MDAFKLIEKKRERGREREREREIIQIILLKSFIQ